MLKFTDDDCDLVAESKSTFSKSPTKLVDPAGKAKHCVFMVVAAGVLADNASTEQQKRALARYCILFGDAGLLWLRRWRNQPARGGSSVDSAKVAKGKLQELNVALKQVEGVRDYLVAKRQPADSLRSDDMIATSKMWLSIDPESIRSIVTNAIEAVDLLSEREDKKSIVDFVEVPAELHSSIALSSPPLRDPKYWYAAADTAAELTKFTLPIAQGGLLGRRIAQINDVAINLDVLLGIAPSVESSVAMDWLVRSAMVTELNAILDLSLGPPPGKKSNVKFPLLELCRAARMESVAIELDRLKRSIEPDGWGYIRWARNSIGAHVDDGLSVLQITEHLVQLDYQGVVRIAEKVLDWLDALGASRLGLGPLLFGERQIRSWPIGPSVRAPGRPSSPSVAGHLSQVFRRIDSRYMVSSPSNLGSAVIAGLIAGRKPKPRVPIEVVGHPFQRLLDRRPC